MTKKIIHIAATAGLIGLGAAVFLILTANKPQLEKTKPPPPVPMVRATPVKIDTVTIPIRGEGTVRPLREISLIPEVSGRVIFVSPKMVGGGGGPRRCRRPCLHFLCRSFILLRSLSNCSCCAGDRCSLISAAD
jgi:hypothetical protein